MKLSDDIEVLKGVGPKKAQQLHELGLGSLFDLLTHFPRSYEDQSSITPIGRLEAGERATVAGVITGLQEKRAARHGDFDGNYLGWDRLSAAYLVQPKIFKTEIENRQTDFCFRQDSLRLWRAGAACHEPDDLL